MAFDLLTGSDSDETIHSFVTRPVVPIVDDGQGNFNISPLGFPRVNVSNGTNPTRITPEFLIGYNNVVSASSRLILAYTEKNTNIVDLYGSQDRKIFVTSLTRVGSTVTVTTDVDHGYVNGKTVTITGSLISDYNGSYSITVTGDSTFTYTIGTTPATPATGVIYSTYTIAVNDLVYLTAQTNALQNGYYVATANSWRALYVQKNLYDDVKVRTNANINLALGGVPSVSYDITSITYETSSTGRYYAIVTTDSEHGFATGNSIVVAGSTNSVYNGTFNIEKLNATQFRYEVSTDPVTSDLTGSATATYQIVDGDLVYAASQTTESEIGLYTARASSAWEFYGFFYSWDGTENDNVAGSYGNELDADGNPLNHYRKGYSLAETSAYLRDKLQLQVQFGKYAGSHRELSDNGAFVQWLLSGRKVNIGGSGSAKDVFVDGFGLGNPAYAKKNERTIGVVDVTDTDSVTAKRTELIKQRKLALWGLTNHHSKALKGFANKSPFLKDYPFIYNSEYQNTDDPYDFLTGGHLPTDVDAERWRMTVTGTSTSTNADVRPLTMDMLWYHRDNSYHNNITLDVTKSTTYGRHSMSIINNLDTPDSISLLEQEFASTDITMPSTITVPDGSYWMAGDFVQFKFPEGTTAPTGISEYTTYLVAAGSPSGNNLSLTDTSNNPISISNVGSGSFIIQRHVFDMYNNDEVGDALDNVASVTFSTGNVLVHSVTEGTVTKYYYKPRKKGSLGIIEPKGSWSANTLSFDAAGANGINIYLNAAETEYITFTHPTFSTDDLWEELNQHNDMIPVPFDPATTDLDSLTMLFVDNTLVDYTNSVNKTNKIRSKKTFVHLPTPIGLADGTPFEIDVSLPTVPDTDSFPFNTLGSVSGYKNYVTQPRVYVLSGYQQFSCTTIPLTAITQTSGIATLVTTNDHGIYTSTFTDSDIDIDDNTIALTNWKDISVGDIVRFKNTGGALPTATPAITVGTDYVVTYNQLGRIKISSSGTDVDITVASGGGTHSIVVQNPLKIDIKGSTSDYYTGQFTATVLDFDSIEFSVDMLAPSPAPGVPYIDRTITVSGSNGVKGLTERYNDSIYSPMPEVEFASSDNLYHQTFTDASIIGNNKTGLDKDSRILLATIYPTTTSTFAWRLDNDPTLRMLPWSIMNISALGGNESTGSFANVAYERNKAIFNEFPDQFQDDSGNGLFSVYDNAISYTDTGTVAFTQQQLNGKIKIKYPATLGSSLTESDASTVGSFNYQAEQAYRDLMNDFLAGRVRVESRRENKGTQYFLYYKNGYPDNHGVSGIPSSFYDQTAGQEFLMFDVIQGAGAHGTDSAGNRWTTKAAYLPEYIVEADDATFVNNSDPFTGNDTAFKTHLSEYFISGSERDGSAENRYVPGSLVSGTDPTFEFAVGPSHKFIDFLVDNSSGTASETTHINDVRRRFWDSYYSIPEASQRQIQNAYHISDISPSIEDSAKFHGSQWIPFARLFSTDVFSPSENVLVDMDDYSTIIGNTNLNSTLVNAIASNPIATKFKAEGYANAFTSVNTTNADSDLEEYLRNYVAGYSNHMPFRHYNGFRIAVSGKPTDTEYISDLSVDGVNTESDMERIHKYSVEDYITEYLTSPSATVGKYLDDNFIIKYGSGDSGYIEYMNLYDIPLDVLNPNATIIHEKWENLNNWTRQTYSSHGYLSGYATTSNNHLVRDPNYLNENVYRNAVYRYNGAVTDIFVVESYIYATDDQLMAFMTNAVDPSLVNYYTLICKSYFVLKFEESDSTVSVLSRKDGYPIVATNTDEDWVPIMNVDLATTYVPNTLYRVVFARLSTNQFMVKMYDTDSNLLFSVSKTVQYPNLDGSSTDDLAFVLNLGMRRWYNEPYFYTQAFASNLTDEDVDIIFGTVRDGVIAEDPNPSWWYFESGNPVTDSVNSTIKDLITVSGMNYLADREFYQNKMKYDYTRIKMSFVFSAKMGRWLPFDYRQVPTSYLTPTFGAQALRQRESTIESNGTETDYLWKYPTCLDPMTVFKEAEAVPYWEMKPMQLNSSCYPYLSTEFPYDVQGSLVDELNYELDMLNGESYRFARLVEPNAASPTGINFIVPNNMHGGSIDPDHSLFLYQPHMWKVYWHMRPAVCAMEGTDIPAIDARTGGYMADPFLNAMFCYPDARDPNYYVPWEENMSFDWLNSGWLLIDARIDNPVSNEDRDLYHEIDAAVGIDPERDNYWEVESANVSMSERADAISSIE